MSTFAQKTVIMENFEEILRKDLHQFYLMGAAMQLAYGLSHDKDVIDVSRLV